MKKKLYSLQEAQKIGTELVEKRSTELKSELKGLNDKNNKSKEFKYV